MIGTIKHAYGINDNLICSLIISILTELQLSANIREI